MREFSKILMEFRKIEPSITNITSALQSQYFDIFVETTEWLADKDVFISPTFAMNISMSLKKIKYCNHSLSTVTSSEIANLKTLIHFFESNWKYDISSQATNNLNLNNSHTTSK